MQYRHRFLAQLALLALLLPFEAQAASPIAAVTASRTSGKVPLLVFFDATATTDSDLTKPIHHLTYCFDAGDGNTDTYSQAGHKTTQKAKFCGAPGWAYVYETTGTHTMTLTVIDEQGNTNTDTIDITVNAWASSDTTCVSTSGTFDQPAGICDTETTSSDFHANAPAANKRVLFRCGETFNVSTTVSLSSGSQIGAYDSSGTVTDRRCRYNVYSATAGPTPQSNTDLFLDINGDDVRVMDGNTTTVDGVFLDIDKAGSDSDNLLIQNWNTDTTLWLFSAGSGLQSGGALPAHIGFFSNNFQKCSYNLVVGQNAWYPNCMYTAIDGLALVDNLFTGSAQHTIRLQHGEDAFIHNNKITGSPENRHQITVRALDVGGCDGGITNRWGENVFISDNWFVGKSDWVIQIGADNGCAGAVVWQRNHILERNYFTDPASFKTNRPIDFTDAGTNENHTVRNNIFDLTDAETFADAVGGSVDSGLEIIGNSVYSDANGRGLSTMTRGCSIAKNNLSWDASGTQISFESSTCTSASGNADANGGETGVANLAACPFSTCPPTTVDHFKPITDGEAVDAGVAVPYRCDFGQEDSPEGTRDIGAWEQGSSTSVCGAAATVAQQPGQNHRINSVTP